jgi:hypothetical protein
VGCLVLFILGVVMFFAIIAFGTKGALFLLGLIITLALVLLSVKKAGKSGIAPPGRPKKPSRYGAGTNWVIMVAGRSHLTRTGDVDRGSIYKTLSQGQILRMVREPENPFDENAIVFYCEDGPARELDLGYVPAWLAKRIAKKMDRGATFTSWVDRVEQYGQRGQFVRLYAAIEMTSPAQSRRNRKALG